MIRLFITLALLSIAAGQPAAGTPRIWIDTDPACGLSATSDPDDCLALLFLLNEKNVEVAGISTVFGNAPVEKTTGVARAMLKRIASNTPIHPGAGYPSPAEHTLASRAIVAALEQRPLTFVALGPLTNLATVLRYRPDLAPRLSRVIAVMGKQPGEIFHPAEGSPNALLGHGPVFSDLNLAEDPHAASVALDSGVPITLAPYALGKSQSISNAGLDRLASVEGAPAWVAAQSRAWLRFWRDVAGRNGFYPFDLLAAAVTTHPQSAVCAQEFAVVAPDTKIGWFGGGPASLMFVTANTPRARSVTVCRKLAVQAFDLLMNAVHPR